MSCASAEVADDTGFLNRSVTVDGKSYRYVVYVPQEFDAAKRWPVLMFLHGSGERGDDGMRQTVVGVGAAVRWNPERFPMIVVFPQAPPDTQWLGAEARFAMTAMERSIAEFHGDPDRLYLTGLSLGGYGVWHLALEHPERFAALVPVCGGIVKPETADSVRQSPLTLDAPDPWVFTASRVKQTPVWIFHGSDDDVIPPSESRKMRDAIAKAGGVVRYSELAGVNHNAWDPAYANAELWSWLLRQRRSGR
jgi:predicted peptidase